jgi:magnesium chelatase family protein
MLSKVFSGAMVGLDPHLIEIEVALEGKGLPSFAIVGLPDKSVSEARDRVRAAINSCGLELPEKKIIVNLAPADLPKTGAAYDFAIAIAILAADNIISCDFSKKFFIGELSLDAGLRPTAGVLPLAVAAKEWNFKEVYVPESNAREAAVTKSLKGGGGFKVFPCQELKQVLEHFEYQPKLDGHPIPVNREEFRSITPAKKLAFSKMLKKLPADYIDFADVKGQSQAKRGLEIAAAGGHNVSLIGPPGAGKTMMARALVSILPGLAVEEALEVSKIYSVVGLLDHRKPLVTRRPFRSPHHTTSRIGLIGGGSTPRPGEISLAHRGVLFLDEFPELPRHVKESLRQPLEDGVVTVSRAAGTALFPAKFIMVGSFSGKIYYGGSFKSVPLRA